MRQKSQVGNMSRVILWEKTWRIKTREVIETNELQR